MKDSLTNALENEDNNIREKLDNYIYKTQELKDIYFEMEEEINKVDNQNG